MHMGFDLMELANGVRMVHQQVKGTKIAHCAIMLDIGSRDEKPHQQGIAHFWEHMAFKGTEKRKAFHIINRLESLGGELNAYTTKEKICFYASVLEQHLEKAIELLVDITFHSIFPQPQIEKERHVILEEMSMYLDSPEDAIQDQLDTMIYNGHQLGNNILGKPESVLSFTKNDFLQFIKENLSSDRVVLSTVCAFSVDRVKNFAEKYLEKVELVKYDRTRTSPPDHNVLVQREKKDLNQAHVALGRRCYDIYDGNKLTMFLLNNILGGHSMNSRLNMALRERNGFVYNIETHYQPMTDTGYFSLFYATEVVNMDRSLGLIEKEFRKLRETPLGTKQLQSAKEQFKGQLAMAEENNQRTLLKMARHILDRLPIRPIGDVFDDIDDISARQIQDVANETLKLDEMSSLAYLP